jgi:penicillin-binding protein 1A
MGVAGLGLTLVALLHEAVVWGAFGPLPGYEELRPLRAPAASEIYSVDGQLLGKYYLEERTPLARESVSNWVVQALVATEDVRFYQHHGVDLRSLGRVLVKSLLLQEEGAGGGSTLTMQLAKNLYPRQDHGWLSLPINKLREIEIAQRMERVFGKEEILMGYLNTVSFGENAFGIETAAQRFFNRPAVELGPEQAALLVGMLKAPSTYNPRRHETEARIRRDIVLEQMHKSQYLSAAEADSLRQLPLVLDFTYATHHDGPAPYFLAFLRQYLERWALTHPKPDGSHWNLYTDGLKIYTPIHSRLQRYAREAVHEQMLRIQENFEKDWRGRSQQRAFGSVLRRHLRRSPRYQRLRAQGWPEAQIDSILSIPRPMQVFSLEGMREVEMSPRDSVLYYETLVHAGFMTLDPANGQIRAWVGGIDHRHFQFDHVTSRRQTGSVFKPLVYAAALENGMAPCEYIPNERVVFQEYGDWAPQNADRSYGGEYSMQGALARSVNVVAVKLLMDVGVHSVVRLARRLGLSENLPAVPSLALGTADASLYEMVGAYAAFFNGGQSAPPLPLLRIEDRRGHLVYDPMTERKPEQVLQPETAALMTYMLRNVVTRGTARSLRSRYGLDLEIAGKTGTTQDQTDGWFIGATPDLLAAAWVGADDPAVHFRSMLRGQGASTALPIWGSFMQKVLADRSFEELADSRFVLPSQQVMGKLDCDDLWFPMAMSEFKAWWQEKKRQDSLRAAESNPGFTP